MLQNIRDRAQSWVFSVVIFLLVIAFAFWGIESYFGGGESSRTVATVDGYKITQATFDNTYQRLRRQLQLSQGSQFSLTPQLEVELKQQALSQLIHDYVTTKAAEDSGYFITQGQIDSVLATIPTFQENGRFSVARFQAVLSNLLYSQATFISQLRTDMLTNQLRAGLSVSAFALSNDVTTAYALINQRRDIETLVIPVAHVEKEVKISEEAQRNYYSQHKDSFLTPEHVSINYIQLSQTDIAAKQTVTDKEIEEYYAGNKDTFSIPASWHVAQILIRVHSDNNVTAMQEATTKAEKVEQALAAGKPFAEVAKQFSEDVATKDNGGVLPWFSAGMMGPEFEAAISALKTGEVSKPVRTKFGISIIKLLEQKPKHVLSLNEVRERINNLLIQQKAQKIFASESDQLSNLTFSDSGSLQTAAKALGLTIQSTPYFSRKGTEKKITSNQKIVNAAFSNTVLVQRYNSDPIEMAEGSLVVLRLQSHEPAMVQPFEKVQADIVKLLTLNAAKEKAVILGQKLLKETQQNKSLQQLAKENNLKFSSQTSVERQNSKIDPAILEAVFALAKPTSQQKSIVGISQTSGDYVLVEVTKITEGDIKKLTAAEQKNFVTQLSQGLGVMDYNLYVQDKINKATVEKH